MGGNFETEEEKSFCSGEIRVPSSNAIEERATSAVDASLEVESAEHSTVIIDDADFIKAGIERSATSLLDSTKATTLRNVPLHTSPLKKAQSFRLMPLPVKPKRPRVVSLDEKGDFANDVTPVDPMEHINLVLHNAEGENVGAVTDEVHDRVERQKRRGPVSGSRSVVPVSKHFSDDD